MNLGQLINERSADRTTMKFENPGDSVTGTICSLVQSQATDFGTGQPATWPDGSPKPLFIITLRETDGSEKIVYLKGSRSQSSKSSLSAVIWAVSRATGTTDIAEGDTLTLTYTGDARTRNGYKMKQYTASYSVCPEKTAGSESSPEVSPEISPEILAAAQMLTAQNLREAQDAEMLNN